LEITEFKDTTKLDKRKPFFFFNQSCTTNGGSGTSNMAGGFDWRLTIKGKVVWDNKIYSGVWFENKR
jgi:hypothetical protein